VSDRRRKNDENIENSFQWKHSTRALKDKTTDKKRLVDFVTRAIQRRCRELAGHGGEKNFNAGAKTTI